jgi:hypothetical protein
MFASLDRSPSLGGFVGLGDHYLGDHDVASVLYRWAPGACQLPVRGAPLPAFDELVRLKISHMPGGTGAPTARCQDGKSAIDQGQ